MITQKKPSKLEPLWNFMCIAIPLFIIIYGAYFIYFNMAVRNKVLKTYADVSFIVQGIHDAYINKKYQNFDTNALVAGNFLPFDANIEQIGNDFKIINRFGGQLYALEGITNNEELVLYSSQHNNPAYYRRIYGGVGSFILVFSKLSHQACIEMAQKSWNKIPGFMGIEISPVFNEQFYSGVNNLKVHVLEDNMGEKFTSQDIGAVSRIPFGEGMAKRHCNCSNQGCSLALKFK